MFQTKEEDKSLEIELNEMMISDLPYKESKIIVIKILTKFRKIILKQTENFNSDRTYKKVPIKNHTVK